MEKNVKSIYKFELTILLLIMLLFFIQEQIIRSIVSIIALGIILLIASVVYKKRKDTNFFKWTATRIMIAVIIFYFIVLLLLGLLIGFSKTFFSLKPMLWIERLLPALIVTIISERLKYLLIKNNPVEKKEIYIITILMAIFNIISISNISTLNTTYKIFVFVCVTVMPVAAQEMLSTYLVCNYGFLPAIVYKLIMNLYVYIIPIMPNLSDYLYGAINIMLPFTIYMVLNKYLKPKEEKNEKITRLWGINTSFITVPIIILLIVIIILVSGISDFQMIAIASNSMIPIYERGDAIIFEKIDKKLIDPGDIIVFRKDNILVAHRVIKTKEDSSRIYFYTKGDANNSADEDIVKEEEVLGIVRRVVKYIGYPTVLINELLRRWEKHENE